MAQCKMCGKSGFLLAVSANGLCQSCNQAMVINVQQRIRIIKDCIKLIETSNNLQTRLSRCELLIKNVNELLKYESKGIATINPTPSQLLLKYKAIHNQLLNESIKTNNKPLNSNWKNSKAHLLLLSKFIHGQTIDHFISSADWKRALNESPQKAIKRFINEGMLINADLHTLVSYKYKITELKMIWDVKNGHQTFHAASNSI
jgi:hypothetical protein